ncbi:MAG: hypothetical protein AB1659_13850 [Thermodesulfobacteriota bacterium]
MRMPFKKSVFILAGVLLILSNTGFCETVLQTQPHNTSDGLDLDLLAVEIRNDVLTLKFKVRNTGSNKHTWFFHYENCYIMDESNQKKYFPLKDSDGNYIAGPVYDKDHGGRFWYDILPGKFKGFWIKFPMPAGSPKSITISIPDVTPFEDVKLGK